MVRVQEGDTVAIHFTGKLKDGTVFEATDHTKPLTFTQGQGRVLAAMEQAVLGMAPGETKTVQVAEEDAYGPYNPDLVLQLDRSEFTQRDIQPEIGLSLEAKQPTGESLIVRVIDISETKVTLDANHPLAGQDLTFELLLAGID